MNAINRASLTSVPLLVAVTFLSACSLTPNEPARPSPSAPRTTVYLNATGDPKLVHRFQMYAADEFDDAGLALTSDPKKAGVTVSAELSASTRTVTIANGLVQMTATAGGVNTDLTQCGSLNSNLDGQVFDSSAKSAAAEILDKFPAAHSVSIDRASNFDAAPEFKAAFESALRDGSKTLSDSKAADVVVTIKLEKRKLSIDESLQNYKIEIASPADTKTETLTEVRFAKLAGEVPKICPRDLGDEQIWLETASLSDVARKLARDIAKGPAR
jgi:hypothetical protein